MKHLVQNVTVFNWMVVDRSNVTVKGKGKEIKIVVHLLKHPRKVNIWRKFIVGET